MPIHPDKTFNAMPQNTGKTVEEAHACWNSERQSLIGASTQGRMNIIRVQK